MKITVDRPTGATLELWVQPTDAVAGVKRRIHDLAGPDDDTQRLIFGGKMLDDSHTLADYGVHEGDHLSLVLGPHAVSGMDITIDRPTGKTVSLRVQATDSVHAVMSKIHFAEGIDEDVQRLIFDGKVLDEGASLESCGVVMGSHLNLVLGPHHLIGGA